MPTPILVVNASPKRKDAYTYGSYRLHSSQYRGECGADAFTALTSARLETTVGINASKIRFPAVCHSPDRLKMADTAGSDKEKDSSEKKDIESEQ